jgi:hypothetical protein
LAFLAGLERAVLGRADGAEASQRSPGKQACSEANGQ